MEYVYSSPSVLNGGSNAVADGRNVSIQVYHSLIAMPENNYEPRFDDQRVGYFTTQVEDQTSTSSAPYRDLIHRWNLVKKNPEAAISEPIEPITWWIENSTPFEWRETIKSAVLQWNVAFEKAGFKNAMVVKVQPDDATWDAGDIRYNVLRWTSSPNPPFGGYGPSFVNPKTGEKSGMISDEVYSVIQNHADKLDAMIVHDRDFNFDFFGFMTLKKSYLLKVDSKAAETPQHLYMRVAVGIWRENLEMVQKTYDMLSQGLFTHATPTLFNAGTNRPQLSSCFLLDIDDDSIPGIYKTLSDCAKISQSAGGIGGIGGCCRHQNACANLDPRAGFVG